MPGGQNPSGILLSQTPTQARQEAEENGASGDAAEHGREARRGEHVGHRRISGTWSEPSVLLVKVLGFFFAPGALVRCLPLNVPRLDKLCQQIQHGLLRWWQTPIPVMRQGAMRWE